MINKKNIVLILLFAILVAIILQQHSIIKNSNERDEWLQARIVLESKTILYDLINSIENGSLSEVELKHINDRTYLISDISNEYKDLRVIGDFMNTVNSDSLNIRLIIDKKTEYEIMYAKIRRILDLADNHGDIVDLINNMDE